MKLRFLLYVSALLVLSAVVLAAGKCTKEGGKDYFVAGIASVEGVGDSPDICIGDNRLLEYYCTDAGLEYEYYDCSDACADGACTGEAPEPPANETCTENWQCGDWSACVDTQKTRTCTDLNGCGTTNNKPVEVEVCVPEQPSPGLPSGLTQYRYYILGGIILLLVILYLVMRKKEPKMESKESEKKGD